MEHHSKPAILLGVSFTLREASFTTFIVLATVAMTLTYNHNTFIVLATNHSDCSILIVRSCDINNDITLLPNGITNFHVVLIQYYLLFI